MEQIKEGGWSEALGAEASNPPTPRTSGETIFALGKQWTLSSCENGIKAQFEQWVRAGAYKGVMDAEYVGGPEAGDRAMSKFLADRAAGHYNWLGKAVRSALNDWPGLQQMLFLLLRRCHQDITEETAAAIMKENPRQSGAAVNWALGNSEAPQESGANNSATVREPVLKKNQTPVTMDGPR